MGIMVTFEGKTLSLTGWAKEKGVSAQRVWSLYKEGKLEDWLAGKGVPGRPRNTDAIKEALAEPCTVDEACEKAGCSKSAFYAYVRDNNVKRIPVKYVEDAEEDTEE